MAPRLGAATRRARLLPTLFTSAFSRAFTRSTLYKTLRPRIPFLSQPTKKSQQVRWQTTAKRPWLSREVRDTVYYTAYWSCSAFMCLVAKEAIEQEMIERKHPSPPEWSFWTRYHYRIATDLANPRDPNALVRWTRILNQMGMAVQRLEDPEVDGDGVVDLDPDNPPASDWVGDHVLRYKDITAMGDEWRRGYFAALLLLARAAGIFDGWLRDRTLDWTFPPECVLGPDNPKPKPVSPSVKEVPRIENCEHSKSPDAHLFYEKILGVVGFTDKERMDAALEYATFLEFKGRLDQAKAVLEMALDLADKASPYSSSQPYDPQTLVISSSAKPSANHLAVLTATATFMARSGATDEALPILLSILRARRQLTTPRRTLDFPQRKNVEKPESLLTLWERLERFFGPLPFPGPLPDGSSQPTRDAAEKCEEAALNAYIGEIMFARGSKEDGLAWTREAVDVSEEEMHNINDLQMPDSTRWFPSRQEVDETAYRNAALNHCRECLQMGLTNWKGMVERMTQVEEEEADKKREEQKNRWISWGAQPVQVDGRWQAEIKVVEDREKRASKLLDTGMYRESHWWDFLLHA